MVSIGGKNFSIFLEEQKIEKRIEELGFEIKQSLQGRDLVLVPVLTGSFLFASDLCRKLGIDCPVQFIKISSYNGVGSTGKVTWDLKPGDTLMGKTVLIIEDIVDSGLSLETIKAEMERLSAKEILTVSLLFKPTAFKGKAKPDWVGFEVPNDFLIGYGLDFNGLGRNLSDIYKLIP